jgi:hypothetical protein
MNWVVRGLGEAVKAARGTDVGARVIGVVIGLPEGVVGLPRSELGRWDH